MTRKSNKIISRAEEVIARLDAEYATALLQRDLWNQRVLDLRTSRRRLIAQLKLVKTKQEGGTESQGVLESFSEMAELADTSLAPAIKKEKSKRKKTAAMQKPKAAPPEVIQETKTPKTPGRIGIMPIANRILRAAFGGNKIPDTVLEVMPTAYGNAWSDDLEKMPRVGGRVRGVSKSVSRPVTDDLEAQNSLIVAFLANAFETLSKYRDERTDEGRERYTSRVVELYNFIGESNLTQVEHVLRNWGVLPGEQSE